MAQRAHTLAADPAFRFALGTGPRDVTSLVYLDFGQLLTLGRADRTDQQRDASRRCAPDLEKITRSA